MNGFEIATSLFLSFVIGAVIGLEREINEKKSTGNSTHATAILGIRSFSLIAVLGAVVGLLTKTDFLPLALLIGSGFFLLLLIFYILDSLETKDPGLTTELAGIWSFVLGVLIGLNLFPMQIIFAITILIALLLSQKDRIKDVVGDIQKRELNAFIGFAIIAVVILPFLPNTGYSLSDIPGLADFLQTVGVNFSAVKDVELINPFKLWLIVALVTGVDLVGYVLEKVIGGKKGWLLTSIVGGFISSTATTQSLAQESKSLTQTNHLVASAVVANTVSFIQITFLIATVNTLFMLSLLPVIGSMILAGGGIVSFLLLKKEAKKTLPNSKKMRKSPHQSIFDLAAALKFAGLFLIISILTKLSLALFGNTAFLLTTGLGALMGLDAVMINTAQLVGGRLDTTVGIIAFLLANGVNLLAKSVYSFLQGSKSFAWLFFVSMIGTIAAGFAGYFVSLLFINF